ncbi:MAG: hypothetical protein MJ082_03675, partial [Clostridia bacterium]|nr:hypothetical protein [Clostridia bacterium]
MKKRILAFLLILAFALPTVLTSCGEKNFNYMTSDLSKYVTIDPKSYYGLEVTFKLDSVTDVDVEESINQIRVANKNKTALYNAGCKRDVPITLGDVVNIYYRGYSVGENGAQTDLDGTCNFGGDVASLEIGSRSFIPGFESGLIGKVPQDYGTLLRRTTTETVKLGDVVEFTYSAIFPHTIASGESAKINLTEENKDAIDAQFGTGFFDYVKTVKAGDVSGQRSFPFEGGTASYSSINFTAAYAVTGSPITVETYFPATYREASLAGKTVYFDVYFSASSYGAVVYETPELDETYLTEALKLTADELAGYEGATMVEQYR